MKGKHFLQEYVLFTGTFQPMYTEFPISSVQPNYIIAIAFIRP